MNIDKLARNNVRQLTPYLSARRIGGSGDIWLNANEYPIASPIEIKMTTLNRYPECQPKQVISLYADYVNLNTNQIVMTRGADEGIELLMKTFCEPSNDLILYCPPTYGMYRVTAEILGINYRAIPTLSNWQLNLTAIKAALDNVKLIYLSNPNNPTGNIINPDTLHQLLSITKNTSLVVIDEAYIEFCPEQSIVSWLEKYPNLVILRTLSKAFALAGLRCGFILSHPEITSLLLKVIAPYPIPTPVTDIAIQALSTKSITLMKSRVSELNALRSKFVQSLKQCSCIEEVYESQSNYVLIKVNHANNVFDKLWRNGIIVRNQDKQYGLSDCIRITVGTQKECQRIITYLATLTR